jgi:hypothetical protein
MARNLSIPDAAIEKEETAVDTLIAKVSDDFLLYAPELHSYICVLFQKTDDRLCPFFTDSSRFNTHMLKCGVLLQSFGKRFYSLITTRTDTSKRRRV